MDLPVFVLEGNDVDVFQSKAGAEGHFEVYDIGSLVFMDVEGRVLAATADGYRVRLTPTDERRLDELRSKLHAYLSHNRVGLDLGLADDPAAAAAALLALKGGRYRWRTRLRTRLPWAFLGMLPKGRGDCGNHEWYKSTDTEDRCYHCRVGVRRPSQIPPRSSAV